MHLGGFTTQHESLETLAAHRLRERVAHPVGASGRCAAPHGPIPAAAAQRSVVDINRNA